MPHISKKKLSSAISKNIFEQLLSYGTDSRHGRKILADLFTDTEAEMLAKRLASVVLLLDGASLYRVSRILHVSLSTAKRFRDQLDQGIFRNVEKTFRTRKQREAFWQTLEKISRGGLPEMGRGRWKWLDEIDKRKKQPFDISKGSMNKKITL